MIEVADSLDSLSTDILNRWYWNPDNFVEEVFGVIPDHWQREVLQAFPYRQRQAMLACKGPGKTCCLAWLGWNFLVTRVDGKSACVSITADTLRDTLWSELAKWQARSPLLKAAFTFRNTVIECKERPDTWWMSARTFPRNANPQQQADTLAGMHGDEIFLILDEAGGIPRAVLATADAALTGHDAFGGRLDQHLVIAGNPTDPDSALGQAVIDERADWHVVEITGDPDDPKRASRVGIEWARKQIAAYGRDNPWVMVNVFGKFPPGGMRSLLSAQDVIDAMKRAPTPALEHIYKSWPLILGVDVARYGDDESTMWRRRGKLAYPPFRMRDMDSVQGAAHVARIAQDPVFLAQSIQIDATGGWGAGWYDNLRAMNFSTALPIHFQGKASEPGRFANRRAEMWWLMAEWVKEGGILPAVDCFGQRLDEMVKGLSTVTYAYRGGAILIEEKEQIKDRLGRSPDLEDGLACTFAYPVASLVRDTSRLPYGVDRVVQEACGQAAREYDPFARFAKESEGL